MTSTDSSGKPVDAVTIELDPAPGPSIVQYAATPVKSLETTSSSSSGASARGMCKGMKLLVGVGVLVLAGCAACVIALFVLHFQTSPSPTTRFSFTNFVATPNTSPSVGDVVSLSSDSSLRNGAGTTAYLSTLSLTDATSYDYINMAPLGTSSSYYTTNLISYRRTTSSAVESVLSTFTYSTTGKTLSVNTINSTNVVSSLNMRGIATLSDTLAVVLTASSAYPYYYSYMTPATISGTSVTLLTDQRVNLTTYSPANFLGRLNSTIFVAAYYDQYVSSGYLQRVKVGTVSSAGAITYSSNAPTFAPTNAVNQFYTNFGAPVGIPSLSNTFIIPYYSSTSNTTKMVNNTGLCVTMATYFPSNTTVSDFSDGVCTTKFMPHLLMDSIMVSDSVLAIAFYDSANNNALTVVSVSISSSTGEASIRTNYVFSDVMGDFEFGSASYGFAPKPTLRVLSSNRLAVGFLNPSASGKMSIKILHFSTSTFTFKDMTPVLPIADSSFSLVYTSGADKAVTLDMIPVSADGVATAYMGLRGTTAYQRFSIVESFGPPVGVIRSYNGKSKVEIAVSGKAKVTSMDGAMTVGSVYYATTMGDVVAANTSSTSSSEYMYSADGSTLITVDSKVGIAVEKTKLFVATGL